MILAMMMGLKCQVSIPSKSGHYSRRKNCHSQWRKRRRFQSPLSRGTTPDKLAEFWKKCKKVSIPSKSGHYSRLGYSRASSVLASFQSPLSRGTTPDYQTHGGSNRSDIVSIPSKSGHYSRPARMTTATTQPMSGFNPL